VRAPRPYIEVFFIFLRLGLTSFGGPVAHIGYFRTEFVDRRRWLDEGAYAGIVGFCQFLPGPASSQAAMALGRMRAGAAGLIAAFVGFTLPSALLMALFAVFLNALGDVANAPWVHGLKLAAVAVVAQALWSMAKTLTPDLPRIGVAVAAAALALLLASELGQIAAIAVGAGLGFAVLKPQPMTARPVPMPRHALPLLGLFFALLAVLPLLARLDHRVALFAAFYRSGALVFGGGHVVLPLLQHAVVTPGWIGDAPFLAGYGAAQAMPGPLFSFAAYLGAAMGGWSVAMLCLCAIYLPSLLLVAGGWPLWQAVSHRPGLRAALAGINAAVVGLLAAALYSPVWTGAISSVTDIAIALAGLLLLFLAVPSWMVVGFGALATSAVALISGA
jgi:chromate transporter